MMDTGTLIRITGIEARIFGREQNPGAPVVVLLHGRTGAMKLLYGFCRDLVGDGFIAVTFDARNHGQRALDADANRTWNPCFPAAMYGVMLGTMYDVIGLLDMLPAQAGVCTERVALAGVSMGGHIALMAAMQDPRVAACAAMISMGDYRQLTEYEAMTNSCPTELFGEHYPAALQAVIERYDPIAHPERLADRPLLFTSGADDPVIPTEYSEQFITALRAHYTHPERLVHRVYPQVKHRVPPEMWADVRQWLRGQCGLG